MENIYYVYEWIRLDTNEPFYVGMGHGKRCYKLTRCKNNHFNNIVKSIPVAVNILHDNLDRQTAFDLEVWYIREYRDIIGYESICNINDGGEGNALCGELNPMYGKSPRKGGTHTEESKDKIRESKKDKMTHIICLNDKKIYESITKASLSYKIERASIRNCCNGYYTRKGKKIKYTNCKGYKFRYLRYKHSKVLRPINYKFKKAI